MRIRLMAATALIPLVAACGGSSSGGGAEANGGDGGSTAAGGGGISAASCVAPMLTVKPAKVHAGDEVTVTGEWFADGCNDTVVNGETPQPPPAFTDMTIEFHQGDKTWPVATDVDAEGEHYAFETTVQIPDDVHEGKATMQAKDHGFATDLEVVAD
jgi:hypothetical protein